MKAPKTILRKECLCCTLSIIHYPPGACVQHINRLFNFPLVSAISGIVAGCTLNSVRSLPTGSSVNPGRALVVYGVAVESDWKYAGFTVELDEYSVKAQAATGDCFHFNRMQASVAPTPGATMYFAFDAPAGAYVYNPFNGAALVPAARYDTTAFAAPAGKIVYVGDFVLSRDGMVAVTRDLDAARKALVTTLPDLRGEIWLAETLQVQRPKPFLCTP